MLKYLSPRRDDDRGWLAEGAALSRATRTFIGPRGADSRPSSGRLVGCRQLAFPAPICLAGNAQLEGKGIAVTIDNSAVTLTWKVRTCAERHQADMTAWSAPGVTSATNDLIVSSNYDRKVRPY